jgi:hypothetical protein
VLKEIYETIETKKADQQASIDIELKKKRRVYMKGSGEEDLET